MILLLTLLFYYKIGVGKKMKHFEKLIQLAIGLIILIINLRTVNMAAVMSVDLGSEWMKANIMKINIII